MSRINKWIDTGISIELMYNLNRNIKAVDIYETIMDAWKKTSKPFTTPAPFKKTVLLWKRRMRQLRRITPTIPLRKG